MLIVANISSKLEFVGESTQIIRLIPLHLRRKILEFFLAILCIIRYDKTKFENRGLYGHRHG